MVTLSLIAAISLTGSVLCAVLIALDIRKRPQPMAVMNVVWPVTALYAGPLALWAYYKIGRLPHGASKPFWQSVLTGTLHCGAGCTLGDLFAEILLFLFPIVVFGNKVFDTWTIDFIFAFVIGVLFQYYALKPIKHLSSGATLIKALQADALSLTCWQIGMYGWMALCFFVLFHKVLSSSGVLFWFMMQIAMLIGLLTAFPINWWLIRKGIKERM